MIVAPPIPPGTNSKYFIRTERRRARRARSQYIAKKDQEAHQIAKQARAQEYYQGRRYTVKAYRVLMTSDEARIMSSISAGRTHRVSS